MTRAANSYVYIALFGDDFDPNEITKRLGIDPTKSWRKGDIGKYNPQLQYSCWQLETERGKEPIFIDNLVAELIEKLWDKIELLQAIKQDFNLDSVLRIVMDIDMNEEESTPALGHDLKTIEFLYKTQTTTDVDIYRYNSK